MFEDSDLYDWDKSSEPAVTEIPFMEDVLEILLSYKMHSPGSDVVYDDSYKDIRAVFLVAEKSDGYWVYIRDSKLGYMKMVLNGFYNYDPRLNYDTEFPDVRATIDFSDRLGSGEINLDDELYDYYHTLPDNVDIKMVFAGDVVSISEAAKILGCSGSRANMMVQTRKLEGFKQNGEIHVTCESIKGRQIYTEQNKKPSRSTSFREINSRSVMSPEKTEECYEQALLVMDAKKDINEAVHDISAKTGMKKTSARMYVDAVLAMIAGELFANDINTYSVNRYLDRIAEEFSRDTLKNALASVTKRFEETKRRGKTCWYYKKVVSRFEQFSKEGN